MISHELCVQIFGERCLVHKHVRPWSSSGLCSGDEDERQLLIMAGGEMAAAGANHAALEYFGLQWMHRNSWRGSLARAAELGLPVSTAPSSDQLTANDHTISALLGRAPGMKQRRLCLAFDRTCVSSLVFRHVFPKLFGYGWDGIGMDW